MLLYVRIFKSRAHLINWARDVDRRSGFILMKTLTSSGPGNKKNPSLNLDVRGVGVIERKRRRMGVQRRDQKRPVQKSVVALLH